MIDKLSYETILNGITEADLENNYTYFMKYCYKYKVKDNCYAKKFSNDPEYNEHITRTLKRDFPFSNEKIHRKIRTKIKYSNYPFEYYKKYADMEYRKNNYINSIDHEQIEMVKSISGIMNGNEFNDYINSLIPGSFGIYQEFKLTSPYFSKDNDEIYIIDNPILKEKVFKTPMIKGSMWKGLMLHSAFIKLDELTKKSDTDINELIGTYKKIYRIFGAGSDNFRTLKDILSIYINNHSLTTKDTLIRQLMRHALFDLGIDINIKKEDQSSIIEQLIEQIDNKMQNQNLKICVQKGRAIFYPTYFNKISLEVLNPHNKKTKAGEQPVNFEVVPKGSEGWFQVAYIPFDAVIFSDAELKKQAEEDSAFICDLVNELLTSHGFGAKTKLGWGHAEPIKDTMQCYFKEVSQNEQS